MIEHDAVYNLIKCHFNDLSRIYTVSVDMTKIIHADITTLIVDAIIHAFGPVWHGGNYDEADLLRSCYQYKLILNVAREKQCKIITSPTIIMGIYCYPVEQAVTITLKKMQQYELYFDEFIAYFFSKVDRDLYESIYSLNF